MDIIQIPAGASVLSVGGFPSGPGDVSYETADGSYRVAHLSPGAVVKWGEPQKSRPVFFRGEMATGSALTRAIWDGYALIAEVERLQAERDHYANPANWYADDEYGPRLRTPAPTPHS